ncbi:AmmeMemoRadiSam system radical SAM enzyme [Acetanaerobacterium elongatum]|uniref:Pyruvate formate lyase activating enzyme n=1 Tax=Acetanaerobacterium elongatum TaxID=258515 RepID=A0A1G9U613_9FIRM|nr:AmmeMemoRadiSam system radical SAM enzyme [Acetanaerobacterium elongatum]SDM55292.1 pyruvate formate lyase activating enzyme [Acetanaerobacterium elongatum]
MKVQCEICPHYCTIEEGHTGLCRARKNEGGRIICKNYGQITSISLDPIEKKPLMRFYPGSKILSVGSYGCNLRCPFCQNYQISMAGGEEVDTLKASPQMLVEKALKLIPNGNIGLAYTYNEPMVGYEFVLDCSKLARKHNLKNVIVTNGFINAEPLKELLPFTDAMNIDLKGFSERFYKLVGGKLETVKQTIEVAASRCHVEVTTLIIPNENDSEREMTALSRWLASISPDIPLHVSRFFPRYKMADRGPTPVETVYRLAETAHNNLKYVYVGNC